MYDLIKMYLFSQQEFLLNTFQVKLLKEEKQTY